jgi:pimeloyl-ACP methyl ester carboxylesterase
MGGVIAMRTTLLADDRVDKLCLISTFASSQYLASDQKPWSKELSGIEKKLMNYFTGHFYEKNKLLVNAMAKQIHKNVTAGKFNEYAAMQRRAMREIRPENWDLNKIKSETLVVHGVEAQIVPIEAAVNIVGRIKKSEIKKYKLSGHLLLAERSQDLSQDVVEFFSN